MNEGLSNTQRPLIPMKVKLLLAALIGSGFLAWWLS